MNERRISENKGEFFILLFVLLALYFIKGSLNLSPPCRIAHEEKVFVEISGNIKHPGIYAFSQPPNLQNLLARAGGLPFEAEKDFSYDAFLCDSGLKVEVLRNENKHRVLRGEMSAFHKMTLGIPISINSESLVGLTAIKGIGPGIARAIVYERARRGGFKRLDELISVPGIGQKLYSKVSPHLVL